MDRKHFSDAVRASIFGGSLSAIQVQGMEALLDEAGKSFIDQRKCTIPRDSGRRRPRGSATTRVATA
ncbi:hypothetical protein [Rhizobium sp. Nf11,1]|uniref:hypothetical protein n=1 Tax=Rhizobium sp. Nf11,1 TaxID=3404923 RepID=UPI003D3567ED